VDVNPNDGYVCLLILVLTLKIRDGNKQTNKQRVPLCLELCPRIVAMRFMTSFAIEFC